MPRKVHAPEVRDRLVKRHIAGESVRSLAKEVGVSIPGAYLWIKRAREAAAESVRLADMSPGQRDVEKYILLQQRNDFLEAKISRLERKVLELVMRGECRQTNASRTPVSRSKGIGVGHIRMEM